MVQVNKNLIKKLLSSKIFLFFIIFALIGLAISVGRESYHKYQLTKEINRLKSEIERIEGRNQQMANLMEYFKEGSYLEKEARLKLNLKKPGEQVVILSQSSAVDIVQTEASLSGTSGSNADIDKKTVVETKSHVDNETANWWKWWEYFFQSSP